MTLYKKKRLCSHYGEVRKLFSPESFYRPLLIFDFLSKIKSGTEKGFPASLNYAGTRGKGNFSFRFSQLVTAASYSEADVSARPNSLNLFYRPLSGTALKKRRAADSAARLWGFVRLSAMDHIMPPMPPMPPIPPPAGMAGSFSSLMSVMRHSVVSIRLATEEAFCRAVRTTLAGSMIPALTMSV